MFFNVSAPRHTTDQVLGSKEVRGVGFCCMRGPWFFTATHDSLSPGEQERLALWKFAASWRASLQRDARQSKSWVPKRLVSWDFAVIAACLDTATHNSPSSGFRKG